MKRKNKLRVVTGLVMTFLFLSGIGIGAAVKWKGSDNVSNIHSNLTIIESKLNNYKDQIASLENDLEGSESKDDHQAIVDQMQKRYENDIAAKDIIIQDYMGQVQELNTIIVNLENELNQAYNDVVGIEDRTQEIIDND